MAYFPRVKQQALALPLFGDTFLRCWQLGQARKPGNAEQVAALQSRLREGDAA